jgi:murein DD-endopeptidase MepM/ murein hydrolase activator NlpD
VHAAASGRVIFAGYDDGFGLTVVLDHGNGLHTRYAHLSSAAVSPGASVAVGALVGRVGATGHATGPHLHFEVTVRGANADPAPALGV